MGPYFMQARLGQSALEQMVHAGGGISTNSIHTFDDPCKNLQQSLNQKPVISGYLSLRYQHFEKDTFAQGCSLTYPGALKSYADLSYANFSESVLIGIDLSQAMINGVNFTQANMTSVKLKNSNAANVQANFSNAVLEKAELDHALLQSANFENVRAAGASCKNADLSHARMFQADFSNVSFSGARLIGIDAKYARFKGADFARSVVSGDISGADFTGATGMNFAAFTQLHYIKGHPPVGLPAEIMKRVQVVTAP